MQPFAIFASKTTFNCSPPIGYSLLKWPLILLGGLGWWPTRVAAQAPVGDGLRGDYYDGIDFAHLTNSRTDGLIKFSWQGVSPISGVSAEHFTVRWRGWLVPPVTGRYVLHLDVDDGVELWLDDRELLGEWRGHSLHAYQVPVHLQAGHAYALRLDYLQYVELAHVHLRWELPPAPALRHSWRTLWGVTEGPLLGGTQQVETIPTRYLFTHWPAVPTAQSTFVVRTHGPLPSGGRVVPIGFHPPPMRVKLSEVRVKSTLPPRNYRSVAPRSDALAAQLTKGRALTLHTLYFAQSKADLLPHVQASLDTLAQAFAQALRQHPTLRVEVQGHTDDQGDSLLNRQLSQQRAEAVCHYLTAHGIPATCLRPVGFGGTQPIADNHLLSERSRNRRVVLRPLR
jgi:outer membrane protein OmpA-like peptidoglycan-associated protein